MCLFRVPLLLPPCTYVIKNNAKTMVLAIGGGIYRGFLYQTCPPQDVRKEIWVLRTPSTTLGCPVLSFLVATSPAHDRVVHAPANPWFSGTRSRALWLWFGDTVDRDNRIIGGPPTRVTDDEAFGHLERIKVTPAVCPRLDFLHFDIQCTG